MGVGPRRGYRGAWYLRSCVLCSMALEVGLDRRSGWSNWGAGGESLLELTYPSVQCIVSTHWIERPTSLVKRVSECMRGGSHRGSTFSNAPYFSRAPDRAESKHCLSASVRNGPGTNRPASTAKGVSGSRRAGPTRVEILIEMLRNSPPSDQVASKPPGKAFTKR